MNFKTAAAIGTLCSLAFCGGTGSSRTVVLDPGHNPSKPGATSCLGTSEMSYNDRLTALIADTLNAHDLNVSMTRTPSEDISLTERTDRSNKIGPAVQISIHHDSAQPKYLKEITVDGKKAFSTITPIRGYSLFVSKLNPHYNESLAAAKSIARELLKLGRKPTLHHAEPIAGENRTIIDSTLGIYQFDDLVVLKTAQKPAVLVEFGVLVDSADEAYVSNPENQKKFAGAISRGVTEFLKTRK